MHLFKEHIKFLKTIQYGLIILLLCFHIQPCSEDQNVAENDHYNLIGPGQRLIAKQGDQLTELVFQLKNQDGNPVSGVEMVVSNITGSGSAQLSSNLTE